MRVCVVYVWMRDAKSNLTLRRTRPHNSSTVKYKVGSFSIPISINNKKFL